MTVIGGRYEGTSTLMEMQEFAGFAKGTQRFIRRSLDVGLGRRDAVDRWARSDAEAALIRAQYIAYRKLEEIRGLLPEDASVEPMASVVSALVAVSAFDLVQGRLPDFAAYRFLYERLLGASVRPWLPAAFCAAAALPHLQPGQRRSLLESAADAVACPGWSARQPRFVPEWVEKVDATIRV